MKKAVAQLIPYMEAERLANVAEGGSDSGPQHAGVVVLATVKRVFTILERTLLESCLVAITIRYTFYIAFFLSIC